MWQIKNIFTKKQTTNNKSSQKYFSDNVEPLVEAEQLSSIINDGLNGDSYSDINVQLENAIHINTQKTEYLFETSSVFVTSVALLTSVGAALICIYFLLIGVITSIFSAEYFSLGILGLSISVIILCINIFLIGIFIFDIRYKIRFEIYSELLGFKNWEFVEDIITCSKQNESVVIKDLRRAINNKLIPQGHFSNNGLVFMLSDKTYDKYMEKPTVYDRYFQTKLDERRRVESRTEQISIIMEQGEEYINKLNDFNTLIKDKTVARKISRLTNVVSMIFHEIDVNPSQAPSLGVFLNYYLPTTEKLLNTYVSIIEKKVVVSNLTKAKKEIEDTLNTIIISFESILERLYEEYEMDISSDIESIALIMKEEGLSI